MDILKEKQFSDKNNNYVCRYSKFPFYYNSEDQKYIYGLTANLSSDSKYVIVDVDEATTLDYLATKYYGRPDYFWIIADFNAIQDPFIHLSEYFDQIKIPSIADIKFKE